MADDATLASILMGGGGDVTTGDVAKRIERNRRMTDPRPVTTLRGSIIEDRAPIPQRDFADDAKAMVASALDPAGVPSAIVGHISPEARDAWRGAHESNAAGSLMGAYLSAPFVGPAVRGIGEAVRAAPTLAKTLIAGAGIAGSPDEAEAQSKLTKAQQRQIEMEKQRAAIEADMAARRGSAAVDERIREQEMQARLAEAAKKREAERPFRERHPDLNAWMPALATAAGFGTGAIIKGGETLAKTLSARRMGDAVSRAESALAGGDPVAKTLALKELEGFNAKASGGGLSEMLREPTKALRAGAAGGLVGTEVGLFPDRMDRASLPVGSPDREAAESRLNPDAQWKNAALNGLAAMSAYKMTGAIPPGMAPVERSQALADILRKGFSADAKTVAKNAGRPVQFQVGAQAQPAPAASAGTGSASSESRATGPRAAGSTTGRSSQSTPQAARTSTPKTSTASSDLPEKGWHNQNRNNGQFAEGHTVDKNKK